MVATEQFCGHVLDVGDGVVIVDRPGSDNPAILPADAQAYRPARPGTYTLASTNETVTNPDYLTTWSLFRAVP